MKLKQTALAVAIGAVLALGSPAPAFPIPAKPVGADPAPKKTTEERLDAIEKQLADLTELLKGKKDSQGFPVPSDPGAIAELKKLKNEIDALKQDLDKVQKSTSLKPALTPDPLAGKGIVLIVNDYPIEVTMAVNNTTYRVAPKTELKVFVPVGDLTYQLLSGANLAPVKTSVEEKKVVTLRVR